MFLGACGPVNKNIQPTSDNLSRIKAVAVVVPEEPEVTVYCDRAKATAAPALMFGLIGAAIASGHNQSLDQNKADQIAPNVTDMSCRSIFSDAFSKRLESSNKFEKIDLFDNPKDVDSGQYDAIVSFNIVNWGLRLVNQDSDEMSSFIEMDILMNDTNSGTVLWQQREVALGQEQQKFETYVDDGEGLRKSLQRTAHELGDSVANTLLYP